MTDNLEQDLDTKPVKKRKEELTSILHLRNYLSLCVIIS